LPGRERFDLPAVVVLVAVVMIIIVVIPPMMIPIMITAVPVNHRTRHVNRPRVNRGHHHRRAIRRGRVNWRRCIYRCGGVIGCGLSNHNRRRGDADADIKMNTCL